MDSEKVTVLQRNPWRWILVIVVIHLFACRKSKLDPTTRLGAPIEQLFTISEGLHFYRADNGKFPASMCQPDFWSATGLSPSDFVINFNGEVTVIYYLEESRRKIEGHEILAVCFLPVNDDRNQLEALTAYGSTVSISSASVFKALAN